MSAPHLSPSVSGLFAHHGKPLRGLMSTAASPEFEGRFGRLFRSLPAAKYGATDDSSREALMALGDAMTAILDPAKDGADPEESGIPALYTYLGQFMDHDITFDPMTTLIKHSDPDALTDFRTPAFDLDNVYGRGPNDQPYMYDGPMKFLLGDKLDNGATDLPRNSANPARALIGDPRNDENSIVSQLQGLFHRFHNRVVDDNAGADFAAVQQIVRFITSGSFCTTSCRGSSTPVFWTSSSRRTASSLARNSNSFTGRTNRLCRWNFRWRLTVWDIP